MRNSGQVRARHVQLFNAKELFLLLSHGNLSLFLNGSDLQHIGRIGVQFKVFVHVFAQHRGRKGPKALAKLDFQVHHRLRLLRARIA